MASPLLVVEAGPLDHGLSHSSGNRKGLVWTKEMGRTISLYPFPSDANAEKVKKFLECHTGNDTVYAIKVRPQKNPRPDTEAFTFAIVQFTSAKYADLITSLVSKQLYYQHLSLKVRHVERDIVPKPRSSILSLESTTLHFGCQVSSNQLCVLYTGQNVMVNFGFDMRKIHFVLSYGDVRYKLELTYEDIWKIQLRCPNGNYKYLLIQVVGAPRIYEKPIHSSSHVFEDSSFNYFKDASDDQWDRATDFTRSCCIGQSSALCLRLLNSYALPDLKNYFINYEEVKGQFILKSGSAFSYNLDLVPIVGPPSDPKLLSFPYDILFRVCSLVQNGCLSGPTLDANFFRLVHPALVPIEYIENALEKLFHLKECCYDPVRWLCKQYGSYIGSKLCKQYGSYLGSKRTLRSPTISLDAGLVYVRRVQVTPSKVYFYGPEANVSNRVLCHYSKHIDNFIRVSFVDENWGKIFSSDLSPRTSNGSKERRTGVCKRILSTLRNGIVIGEERFDFLAFSSRQLRDNSAWMFAKTNDEITASKIRKWMGDFHEIRNVAKYAARLGQSFSSSTETFSVEKHEVETISDIKRRRGGMTYIFSDGIGKISADFAAKVARKCGLRGSTPSAFQIRYGGYKGVVAVDPTSTMKLSLRKSMCKYKSENTKLDVLAWSKYQPCFLNRQLITLLSTLGVNDRIFLKKQRQVVDELDAILTDPSRAQETLELMSPGENSNVLKEMLKCGYKPNEEPFLSMMLQAFRAAKLHELRTKTRIFVSDGRSLMGCMDETRTLEYGQVFVQVSSIGRKKFHGNSSFMFHRNDSGQQKFIVEGMVVVAKNPCLHPGDVRVLQAVNVPALHHMVDSVVFPQKGPRPHPNECSGSDLDGDVYFVSWDSALILPWQFEPMEYVPAPTLSLDHDVTMEEVEEYFAEYIVNEILGIIANAHTVFADREPSKALSENCLKLAKLFSVAVDFPKTGVPAEIPDQLRVNEFPDFMEKLDKPTYESRRVIGKLFREIKEKASETFSVNFTREVAWRSYDPDMEVGGFEDYIEDALYYKGVYDSKLGNLMDYYGINTEAEILSGNIMKMAKSFTKKRDAEAVGLAVKSLKKEARGWFGEGLGWEQFEEVLVSSPDKLYAKASAWYHVTYHPKYWGYYNEGSNWGHFLSFPWCIYDKLIEIKKDSSIERRTNFSSLEGQFTGGLNLSVG